MKRFVLFLFLFISGFSFSQFNRSYFHMNPTISNGIKAFSAYAFLDVDNKQQITSLYLDSTNKIHFTTLEVNDLGDVVSVDKLTYNSPVVAPDNYSGQILGIFDQPFYRFYVIEIGSNNNLTIVWLRYNKLTQAVSHIATSMITVNGHYIESKLIGNEIVSYLLKGTNQLHRFAIDVNSFTLLPIEVVSSNLTSDGNFASQAGCKAGYLFQINGQEKLVLARGEPFAKIYTRVGANNYTSVATSIATNRSVSAFLSNSNTLTITNGQALVRYDENDNLMTTASFPSNSIMRNNTISYINNQYHIFTSNSNSIPKYERFFLADTTFHFTDSLNGINTTIFQVLPTSTGTLIVGNGIQKRVEYDIHGKKNVNSAFYFEKYQTRPKLMNVEYFYPAQFEGHIRARIGIGLKPFIPENNGSALYDSTLLIYNQNEICLAYTDHNTVINSIVKYSNAMVETPGPYTNANDYDEIQESKYNRTCHVTLKMIHDHLDSVASGSSTYIPVDGIRNWPGNGDISIGQAAIIAPFADANQNGIYEPMLGDYPIIYGDNCYFSVSHRNDSENSNQALEYHSYIYTQSCDTSDLYNEVLMRKLKIISRSVAIDSLYFGLFVDGDLGGSMDDYIGSNVDLGMGYFYNGDLYDDDYMGNIGFHDTLGAIGLMVLKGLPQENDELDNAFGVMPGQSVNGYGYGDGIIDNECTGMSSFLPYFPSNDLDEDGICTSWRHMLSGIKGNGDTIYYGYNNSLHDSIATRYAYPWVNDQYHFGTGGIDPGYSWSEKEFSGPISGTNSPGERVITMGFGKSKLALNESIEIEYAFLATRENQPSTSIYQPLTKLFNKGHGLRSAYLSNEGPCGTSFDQVPSDLGVDELMMDTQPTIIVYPNPNDGVFQISAVAPEGGTVQIFDINGKLLEEITNYQENTPISVSHLEGHLFIVRISDKNQSVTRKIIKR